MDRKLGAVQLFHTDRFAVPLPPEHRFPMAKYALLREALVAGGVVTEAELAEPEAAPRSALARVHTADYLERIERGALERLAARRLGFPWSPALVERSRRSVGATLAAARAALERGAAGSLAGGTHHAFADRGEGYCVFNDVAVAARALAAEGRIRRALVVDLDVHQGDGTAAIFAGDPAVYTYSVHGARNYPFRKERSDLDVALADGTGDAEYLAALDATLPRALLAAAPDLVFYIAGADPYAGDRLGRLALTRAGLARRDDYVFGLCREHALPVAVVLGGGYARDVGEVVAIHVETFRRLRAAWFGAPRAGPAGGARGPDRPSGFAAGPSPG